MSKIRRKENGKFGYIYDGGYYVVNEMYVIILLS